MITDNKNLSNKIVLNNWLHILIVPGTIIRDIFIQLYVVGWVYSLPPLPPPSAPLQSVPFVPLDSSTSYMKFVFWDYLNLINVIISSCMHSLAKSIILLSLWLKKIYCIFIHHTFLAISLMLDTWGGEEEIIEVQCGWIMYPSLHQCVMVFRSVWLESIWSLDSELR